MRRSARLTYEIPQPRTGLTRQQMCIPLPTQPPCTFSTPHVQLLRVMVVSKSPPPPRLSRARSSSNSPSSRRPPGLLERSCLLRDHFEAEEEEGKEITSHLRQLVRQKTTPGCLKIGTKLVALMTQHIIEQRRRNRNGPLAIEQAVGHSARQDQWRNP